MPESVESISVAMRRYAAEVYRLQEEYDYVPIAEVAEHIGATPQAVSRMVQKLKEGGYADHQPYLGVRLTGNGAKIAMPAIRRHRLIEVFLVNVMNFGWEEVHEISGPLERAIDEIIEDRMYELSGRPSRCPHGEPIPGKDGNIQILKDISLTDMHPGCRGQVSRVRTHNDEMLRYLRELHLVPGVAFRLEEKAPFEGPFQLRVGTRIHTISFQTASALWVDVLPHMESREAA